MRHLTAFAIGMASMAAMAQQLPVERSPGDWFMLVASIERDLAQAQAEQRLIAKVDHEDRRFVREMLNRLSVSADAKPTPPQGQWLLAIRAWIDAAKK